MAQTQTRMYYKNEAKEVMKGQYPSVILFGVITLVLTGIVSTIGDLFAPTVEEFTVIDPGIPFLYLIFNIVLFGLSALIAYGYTKLFYAISLGQVIDVKAQLQAPLEEQPFRSILLRFFMTLFLSLWTLLLIIPGIVKAYAYAMSYYHIMQGEQDPLAAITASRKTMFGHKMELFVLDLSYLGWYILGIFTLGILYIWIIPRHMSARMLMFNDLYGASIASDSEKGLQRKVPEDPFAAYER